MLGKVEEDIAALIVEHLDQCEKCEETVVSLEDKEDTFVGRIPKKLEDSSIDGEINGVVSRIKNAGEPPMRDSLVEDIEDWQDEIGDYRVHQPLGMGGMGTVFKATHSHLDKTVALKVLPHRKMQNSEAISRFRREMKIVGQLDHPAIVQATDAGHAQGTHYLAMEFVDGLDLGLLIKYAPELSDGSCCEWVRQAANGIAYVHNQGVIHRDIKPSNLMLTRQGQVKILDLGLATLSGITGIVDDLTTVGQLMGTIDYMAPEQYGDTGLVDHKADVYALGATLYKLLTRQAPYDCDQNESPLQKLKRIANESPVPILQRKPDLDPALAEIVGKAISRETDQRYQSAEEFAKALVPFCRSNSVEAELETALQIKQKALEESRRQEQAKIDEIMVSNPYEESIAKEISLLTAKVDQLEALNDGGKDRKSRSWWTVTLASFFVLAALCCGIIIQIEMDKGRLVIDSESDNVKVTLLKDGKVYDKMELEQGTNSTRIRAGKYEVVIDEGSDKLTIDQNQFKLTRGETIVAKIVQESPSTPKGIPKDDSTETEELTGPVYQGLNLAQWLDKTRRDIFKKENVGDVTPIKTAPIRRLASFGPQSEIDEAASFWASVIENETSMDQLYRLVPLLDSLANNDKNADLLTERFLDTLFRNFDPNQKYVSTIRTTRGATQRTSMPVATILQIWSEKNRTRIEAKLFSQKFDKAEKVEDIRMAFLKGLTFNTNAESFSATHQNILNLLKTFNESRFDNRLLLGGLLTSLTRVPEKLSSGTKSELKTRLWAIAQKAEAPFKETAIRCLIGLGDRSESLLEEIVDNLDKYPELIPLLIEFKDIEFALNRIEKLLRDHEWGWTHKFRAEPITRSASKRSKRSSSGGGSAMLGGMMSGDSGMMSTSGGAVGNMSSSQFRQLLGQGGATKPANLRLDLVFHVGELGGRAKSLLPVLRSQQQITSNQPYLENVWEAYTKVSGQQNPKLYAGKELETWKQELGDAKQDSDLALAMIAVADLIGELSFDARLNQRSTSRSRSSRSSSFRVVSSTSIENRMEYVRFMQSLLLRLRKLNFDDFDSSVENYGSCFEDPRMAAFLLGNPIALDLIRVATDADYDFISCLQTESYDDDDSYKSFLRAALQGVRPGSITQFRFVAKSGKNDYKWLANILEDEKTTPATKILIMEKMLDWQVNDEKALSYFPQLVEKHPDITLAMLAWMNVGIVNNKTENSRRFGGSAVFSPTPPALLAFDYLLRAKSLETEKNVEVFPEADIYLSNQPIIFTEQIRGKTSRIEKILDILLLGNNVKMNRVLVEMAEDDSTVLDSVALLQKLKAIRPNVEPVVQNKIDKFTTVFEQARKSYLESKNNEQASPAKEKN